MLLDCRGVNYPFWGAESGPGSFRSEGASQTRHGETSYSSSLIPTEMATYRLRRWTRACTTFLDWRQGCVLCCVDVGTQATEQRAMLQDLFKCKPAIMRAFQAAKGVNTVTGCEHLFSRLPVRYFLNSLSDILRSGERVVTILRDCVMRSGWKQPRRRLRDAERIPAAAGVSFFHLKWGICKLFIYDLSNSGESIH